jgi:hypothetical protein
MVQGPTGTYGASAIDPLAPWYDPKTGKIWRADPEAVRKWREEGQRRYNDKLYGTTTGNTNANANTNATPTPPTPTPGPTKTPTGTPTGTPTAASTGPRSPAGSPPPSNTATPSTRTGTPTAASTGTRSVSAAPRAADPKDQPLYDRAANVINKIPQAQRGFLMRDIMSNPTSAAQKYGISENDAYMLAGYYRKANGR